MEKIVKIIKKRSFSLIHKQKISKLKKEKKSDL